MSEVSVVTVVEQGLGDITVAVTSSDATIATEPDCLVDVVVETDSSVSVLDLVDRTTLIAEGIEGPPGPAGPQGPAGISAHELYDVFAIPSWSHAHAYPYPPDVRLVDVSGEEVETGVEYPDPVTVSISFPSPFTGTIILS